MFLYVVPGDRRTQNPTSIPHAMGQVPNYIKAIQLRSLCSSQMILVQHGSASRGCQDQSLSFENLFLLLIPPHLLMQILRSNVKQSAEASEMFFMYQDLVLATALPLCITTS